MDWTTDDWPGWQDSGKRVEIETDDGRTIQGALTVDDVGNDGEDEYPIFNVRADDGTEHSFASQARWRFLPAK